MRAIIHIGLEKTGTTSIQSLLTLNKPAFEKAGIFVSSTQHAGNNFYLALASYTSYRGDSLLRDQGFKNLDDILRFRAKQVAALKSEVALAKRSGADRFVLSSEHFQSRLKLSEDIETFHELLRDAGLSEFEIVVYLRDPLKIALSHHGMAIKKGVHVDEATLKPDNRRVIQILNFKGSLSSWIRVFGKDALNVRLYPEGKPPTALLSDFLQVVGYTQPLENLQVPGRENRNLSSEALAILNQLNAESDLVKRLWSDRKLFKRLEEFAGGKGLVANPELQAEYSQFFATSNQWVREEFFAEREFLFENTVETGLIEKESGESSLVASEESIRAGAAVLRSALELLVEERSRSKTSSTTRIKQIAKRLIRR